MKVLVNVQPIIRCEINPLNPVPEICAVIMAVMPYNKGYEESILKGVIEATEQRLVRLEKGVKTDGDK
ncbi:hypothetical protein D3C76_459250 [compost metagenome]